MRKFKKLTMTLALLIMAVGGAWAQTTVTWDSNTWADWTDNSVKTHTVDGVTITTGGTAYAVKSNDNLYIWVTGNANTLTFSSDTPITRIEMTKATPSTTLRLTPNDGWSVSTDGTTVTWEGTATKSLVCETCTLTVSKIKFYLETAAEPTEVIELKPDETGKTWTLDKMPASNVELQVEYEPTKVTMAVNDKTMGTVEVGGKSKVEWTADTWKGWTSNDKEHTVDDITMTSSDGSVYEYTYDYSGGKYKNSLNFFVDQWEDNSTVTFSTTGAPFSRIEFTMIDNYSEYTPNIKPNDNWTFEGKSAVWEGEATKSLTLQSCSTYVSKITFFKGGVPDGVTVNGDGTFTVAKTATVTLTATPAEGYKFLYWEDDPTNTNPVREVTIESGMADMTYKAVFEEITYNVTFVDGIEEADEWSATPNTNVKKETKVDIKYTGAKKVIGVKVEKKEESLIVNPEVGQYIGSDGKNYDANATLPDGVTKVAMITYVGNDAETSTTYNHGLALALEDVSSTTMNWCSQADATCLGTQYDTNTKFNDLAGIANTDALVNHTGHTHAAASAARNYNSGTHPAGTSAWFLPSAGQWNKMFTAAGGYANLKTMAGLQDNDENYWSSTEYTAGVAWDFYCDGSWYSNSKSSSYDLVRPCLAF